MPDRIVHGEACSPKGYGGVRVSKASGFEAKSSKVASGGRSVKKLVRSLSDRYAAVTSPLTCKRKTSCSSRNPSLKTLKSTAATSLLPLKPALSATHKSSSQSVAVAASGRKDSPTSTTTTSHVRAVSSVPLSKSLLHRQVIHRTEASLAAARTHIVKRSPAADEDELRLSAPLLPVAPLHSGDDHSGNGKVNSAVKQVMGVSLQIFSPVERGVPCPRQAYSPSQALSYRTMQDWQQLEALLKLKDDEIESIQTAGLMLKDLCMKQDEEIMTLKASFPATLKEMAQLREGFERQEKELAYARVALPAMQAQVTALTEQLKTLTEELAQMKIWKEASPGKLSSEKVSSHFHEREASNSSCSMLSTEPSPVMNGFLEPLRRSRRGQNHGMPCEDQGLLPVRVAEAAGSSCSSVTSVDRSCEIPSEENKLVNAKHKRGFSVVLSVEHMLKGSGRRSGRKLVTDKEIEDTLQELDKAADKEQALLQEKSANAVKELRSSSSRFVSLEPIKSILTCASPQLFEDPPEDEEINLSPKWCKEEVSMWNLNPT